MVPQTEAQVVKFMSVGWRHKYTEANTHISATSAPTK